MLAQGCINDLKRSTCPTPLLQPLSTEVTFVVMTTVFPISISIANTVNGEFCEIIIQEPM